MRDDRIIVNGTFLDAVQNHPAASTLSVLALLGLLLFFTLRGSLTRRESDNDQSSPPHP
jgi:hypothetical protein